MAPSRNSSSSSSFRSSTRMMRPVFQSETFTLQVETSDGVRVHPFQLATLSSVTRKWPAWALDQPRTAMSCRKALREG